MDNVTQPKMDFAKLMGKAKSPVLPISQVIEKVIEPAKESRHIEELRAMLNDKSIPVLERIKIKRQLDTNNRLAGWITPEQQAKINGDAPKQVLEIVDDKKHEQFALDIKLNAQQLMAVDYGKNGKSFVLTGKAGTGKTTTTRELAKALLENNSIGTHHFGYYNTVAPAIAFCAYTNRATDNMRRSIHKDEELKEKLPVNILTIHKLLEYTMEWREDEFGKKFPYFYPKRNASNKLDLDVLIIEEASMIDIPFWRDTIYPALPEGCVVIFIGDINQLPPVFGPSIMNYALIKLPVVELQEVYRQALDSPILSNALTVLDGNMPTAKPPAFKIFQSKPGGTLVTEQTTATLFVNSVKKWYESGEYDPETDIILSPINKQETKSKDGERIKQWPCSTKNLNYHIAQFLGDKRGVKVHEILAGRNTMYLAEGDRVMVEKQDGTITKINMNAQYIGRKSRSVLYDINRFGAPVLTDNLKEDDNLEDFELTGFENLNVDVKDDDSEKKQAASHVVHIKLDDGQDITLESAGDFSDTKFNLGYCLSVHKAQGSEWRKVFMVLHKQHAVLLFRELIYTAMTRAREELVIVDPSNSLEGAIKSQRIRGNTLKEKIEYFNAKMALTEPVEIIA